MAKYLPDLMLTCAARYLFARKERYEEFTAYVLQHQDRLNQRALSVLQRDVREEPLDGWFAPIDEVMRQTPNPTLAPLLELQPAEYVPHPAFPDPEDWLVLAAFNYCLGRRTYVVADCTAWLKSIWPHLEPATQDTIITTTKEAIAAGTAGSPTIDVPEWQALIHHVTAAAA